MDNKRKIFFLIYIYIYIYIYINLLNYQIYKIY